MNTNDEFWSMARDIFGEERARPTARLLGVRPRTAERWLAGTFEIPPERMREMREHHRNFFENLPALEALVAPIGDQVHPELFAAMLTNIADRKKMKD